MNRTYSQLIRAALMRQKQGRPGAAASLLLDATIMAARQASHADTPKMRKAWDTRFKWATERRREQIDALNATYGLKRRTA